MASLPRFFAFVSPAMLLSRPANAGLPLLLSAIQPTAPAPLQEPAASSSSSGQETKAPVLRSRPALAPVASMKPGDPAQKITLMLEIDAQGQVSSVRPLRLEDPFFAAATEAALGLRFIPATRKGEPMPSRMPYTFVFHPPAASDSRGTQDSGPTPQDPNQASTAPAPNNREDQNLADPQDSKTSSDIIEVQAKVQTSAANQKEQSAQAVQSLSIKQERAQSSDLGRALRKSRGLSVQQSAGLGSNVRVLLAGYTGPQVRYFFDGLPLAWSGYVPRISAISAELVGRVDVFEGVVPVHLGTDALGGALHIISRPQKRGTHGGLGYEMSSFGNHRLVGRLSHGTGRHFFSLSAQYDSAQNRYPMKIEVPNAKGVLQPRTVYRFHDAFTSLALRAAWTYKNKRWRTETILFGQRLGKELQSNLVMTVPFGDASFSRARVGLVTRLHYEKGILRAGLDLGGSAGRVQLSDLGTCRYDWFGRCVRDNGIQGEIGSAASDQHIRQRAGLAIPALRLVFSNTQQLVLRSTLSWLWRKGENRALVAGQLDPLRTPRTMFSTSTGASYNLSLWQHRVRNELFAKLYTQGSSAVDYGVSDTPIKYKTQQEAFGWGDALRVELLPGWQVKASYEWTTRMPGADERFGDGVLILPNLELTPERSHNYNLSTSYQISRPRFGQLKLGARGYLRQGEALILLLGAPEDLRYRNMLQSQVLGGQLDARFVSPRRRIEFASHFTFQRPENRSREGDFSDYLGDRIPNQPYRWGHAQLSLHQPQLLFDQDRLTWFFSLRWVGKFSRTWESLGLAQTKQFIPAQTTLSTGLSYRLTRGEQVLAVALTVDNLSNARVFDFFGVPRPGRSFSSKINLEF